MNKLIIIFPILFFLFNRVQELNAQELVLNSSVTGVCYAGNKVTRIYIPPPKEYFEKMGSKGLATVTFYYIGFPPNAIKAMEKAALILETMLPPDTRLTILANWEDIPTDNILGQSVITGYAGGWGIDALDPFALYPVSLAEKISGKSLNADIEGDIQLTINSSINWYFGTDGGTPTQQYDLITVALHEICHGLGFFDSMNTFGTLGSYGFDSIPMIYDTFIETYAGKKLTDALTFQNPSAALHSEFTQGKLYFNGPLLKNFTSGPRAKIYAPSTWDPGSSISHLEEQESLHIDELGTLQSNALMTPFIDRGEAIHNPGKLTMSILGDLGWVNTRIIHQKLKDTEEALSEVGVSVTINSDTTYNHNRIGLVYSFDNFVSNDTVYLTSLNSDDNFNTTISIPSYEIFFKYYFFAEDKFLRLYKSPSLAELDPYHIFIGTDTVKPVILHNPVEYYFEKIDLIKFNATVTDNIGIDTVYIEYKKNEGPAEYIGLTSEKFNVYSASISSKPLFLEGGDSIQYRIIAIDKASGHNVSILPETGFYSIRIEAIGPTLESYSTDFSDASDDFFNVGFEISKTSGFSSYALHSKHPYVSPEDNNLSLNFTAMLRNPVKFDDSGIIISYSELVLVEPGEPGSLFGTSDFYDYVILEASKDFGKTWFKLIDGYDSRYMPSWENAYNSILDAQGNSEYIGTESMMVKRTIFPLESGNVSHGDTLLFRFRLYSDPFANGWGWVIDDLKINQLIDNIENITADPLKVYPNPGNGLITVRSDNFMSNKPIRFGVFNPAGICIINDYINDAHEATIDISSLSSGFYFIRFYFGNRIRTIKYCLIK